MLIVWSMLVQLKPESLLLRHADHQRLQCFLFPAPIVPVVLVNGDQTAWYTQIMLRTTPTIITTLGVETRFPSERGADCTPVGERGLPNGLRFVTSH